jgi:hypothetical protein
MAVGVHHEFFTPERANQHEQSRLREVKVREQSVDYAESVAGIDKNVGFAGSRFYATLAVVLCCQTRRIL